MRVKFFESTEGKVLEHMVNTWLGENDYRIVSILFSSNLEGQYYHICQIVYLLPEGPGKERGH